MKKNKIVIITLILGILFLSSYLYDSYATSTGVSLGNDENTYDILLNDSTDTVSVPAKSSKTVYYQFSNTNKGTVKYHIGYISNNVIAKVWWDTEDKISGTIEQGEYKFIKLKLINDTTSDDTITIKPVLGYVNGGDVIPDSNTTLVTGSIKGTNTWNKAVPVDKSTIKEIYFVNDNIVPTDALGSKSGNSDSSIMTWYTESDTEGQYKVYIGSDNGITSFPTNSSSLFNSYTNVISINLDNIDTSKVTNIQAMFAKCSNLISLDLSNFDTSNVTSMNTYDVRGLFQNCSKLISLNLSNFDTSKVSDFTDMFAGCSSLKTLDLSSFDTSNATYMSGMFYGCSSLILLDLSNFNTSKVIDMGKSGRYIAGGMFEGCSSLTSLDLSSFDTSSVNSMNQMFKGCSKLISLNLSSFDISNVTSIDAMFEKCSSIETLDLSSFKTFKATSMASMFHGCSKLTNIDLSNLVTTQVTSLKGMFAYCTSLKKVDFIHFATPNLTSVYQIFWNAYSLEEIDLSSLKPTNLTDFGMICNGCSKLKKVNFTGFDFNKVDGDSGNTYSQFRNVPNSLEVTVTDCNQVGYFNNKFPQFTNVHTPDNDTCTT